MRAAAGVVLLLALLIGFFTVPLWMMAFEPRPPHGFQPVYPWFSTALVFTLVVTGLWLRKSAQR